MSSLIAVVGLWQLLTRDASQYAALPSPSSIFGALYKPGPYAPTVSQELPSDALVTVSHAILGLILGFGTGVPIGLAMTRSESLRAMLGPYVTALNTMPRIALLPLLIIIFGFGATPGLVLIWSAAFVVVLLNTMVGARSVQRVHLEHVRVLGASPLQLQLLVVIPAIVPWLIAALRLGLGYSFTIGILAETTGVSNGLGYLLVWYANQAFAPGAFLVVCVVTILALLLDGAIVIIERLVLTLLGIDSPRAKSRLAMR